VDAPLVFDIVDTWSNRSIGGCTYHVSHPGGRSYDAFPVNSYEAESRRVSRFWDHGHTQGVIEPKSHVTGPAYHYVQQKKEGQIVSDVPEVEINKEFPRTLDLRQFWNKKMY
jgi:uncharacterized protein (DUF2126 family)